MSQQVTLNLTPDTKVLIALTHTHIQPLDALCELIDNAIDSFHAAKLQGISLKNTCIKIDLPKEQEIDTDKGVVRISDNGPGLSMEAAEKALRAGFSANNPYDTLGLFGMGFNISTGKLGSVTRFFSAREDDDKAIEVTIDLNKINESKDYEVEAFYVDKGTLSHGTVIEVSNWWPHGNDNRGFVKTLVSYGSRKIRAELGRRYATILRQNEINIFINDIPCEAFEHCIWDDSRYVEKQKHGKIPAVFRFDTVLHTQKKCAHCTTSLESYQNQCPACGSMETRTIEERIKGWVGIQRFDDLSEFGIDLIRNGRAIRISEKSAFFEFVDEFQKVTKDYPIDSNFGRIVGEVHLNHVPVDFMKQDFQRSSPEWHRAITFLRGESSLQPTQPGADKNESPIYKLFQGYRKVKNAGRADLYMGVWDPVKEEPRRISRDVEKEFYEKFKKKEPGYYDDLEWWKKVEEADKKPMKKLSLCEVCGCQNIDEAEVCVSCQAVLKGKKCIDCGELIPLSAKQCPKCGKNQEAEIIKPWTCNVCGHKNIAELTECSQCHSVKGEENQLSKEYLIMHSNKNDMLSISACTIKLSNDALSSPLDIEVYETNCSICANHSDKNIPVFTVKNALNSLLVFIDKSHKIFKNCSIKVEQLIATEIAEHIYLLNKSIPNTFGTHTVPYIAWQIIEKYWIEKMDDNAEELSSAVNDIFDKIRERLVYTKNPGLSDYFDLLDNEQQKIMVNKMINAGEDISKLNEFKNSCLYLKYVPAKFLGALFKRKPEYFFDGNVWDEPYLSLEMEDDVRTFMQERTRNLYQCCIDDVLFFDAYESQSDIVTQKTKLAIQLLKQKVAE